MNGLKKTPSFEVRQFETTITGALNAAQARALSEFITSQPSASVPANIWSFGEKLRMCASRAEDFARKGAEKSDHFVPGDEVGRDAEYLSREPA